MPEDQNAIVWEGPEHVHLEKSGDWFWALAIIAIAGAIAAIMFENILLGILILLCAGAMALSARRDPEIIEFAVTNRGVRVGETIFPYNTLAGWHMDEENPHYPHLLIRRKSSTAFLLALPVPEDMLDEIEDLLKTKLPTEELEEPFAQKILEFFGF